MSRRAASVGGVACLVAVAGFSFHRVYGLGAIWVLVLVAATLPTVLGVLLQRWSLPAATACSIVALLLAEPLLVFHEAPFSTGLHDVVDGLVNGWARVLDTTLPVPNRGDLLTLVPTLVWLASFCGTEVVLRSRARLLPALPALIVLVVGFLFSVHGPSSNVAVTIGFLMAAALLLVLRRVDLDDGPVAPTRTRVLVGVALLAVVTVCAAVLGAFLLPASRTPFDVRQYRSTPLQDRAGLNPLDLISGYLADPTQALFTVRASEPQNWRLAVLDRFDGITWSSSSRYAPGGITVPPEANTEQTSRVTQKVTIEGLSGIWLPAAVRPADVRGDAFQVDLDSGSLASVEPLRPGLAYEVTSRVPRYQPAQLSEAVPDTGDMSDVQLPPGVPPVVSQAARTATQGAVLPIQQALLLEQYLRRNFRADSMAPPGHSYGHLKFFLDTSQRGTSEQFATAFAVMARTLGLPTRVAVGFTSGTPAPDGVYEVRSGNVLAWPEVKFQGLGWMPFFPTPAAGGQSAGQDKLPGGESSDRASLVHDVAESINKSTTGGAPAAVHPANPHSGGWNISRWLRVAAGVVLSYLLLLSWLLAGRALRQRYGTPGQRISAAWRRSLAALVDVGVTDTRSLSSGRAVQAVPATVNAAVAHDLAQLGALVDRALFAAAPATDADADEAWHLAGRVARAVRGGRPLSVRVRRLLSPRVLLPRMHQPWDDPSAVRLRRVRAQR